ncbi:hypothetical protein J3B02_001035 [Coemansia erecta]|nr:hypothetical protein J3B02_001035 [Coemansia erecta]
MVRRTAASSARRRVRRPRSQSAGPVDAASGPKSPFLPSSNIRAVSARQGLSSASRASFPNSRKNTAVDSARISFDTPSSTRPEHGTEQGAAQLERMTFFSSPLKVSYYSTLYLKQQLRHTAGYIVQYPLTLAYSVALGSIYTALHFFSGPHVNAFRRIDSWVGWHSYWVLLGVLSSIGLGAGLHTFVLFLGPLIARVTLTAYECGHTSFAVQGHGAFQCGSAPAGTSPTSFSAILFKVLLESLCWGTGTAIGELPPYFIARAASAAGQGDVEYQRLKRKAQDGRSLAVKDRALLSVYHLLQRFGFAGILAFAAIPNPLFDLAGITCGHFGVPFWTFFGATFLGKSVIKSTMQTAVVITAFSKEMIATVLSFLEHRSPWAHDLAEQILRNQVAAFEANASSSSSGASFGRTHLSADGESASSSLSLLGSVWNACISIMLIYFVISTLETFAQSYLAEVKSWGQNQLSRVGSHSRTTTTIDIRDSSQKSLNSSSADKEVL